jgi:hypothetical protein
LPASATNEPRAIAGDRVASGKEAIGKWGVMHMHSGFWLDCDLGSFTVLMIGISAVSLLALSAF